MASYNTSTIRKRFEAGSTLTINDGTNTYTVLAVKPGSLSWKVGGYKAIPWRDRGILMTPLEGDEQANEVEFEGFFTGVSKLAASPADLYAFLKARDTTTGNVKLFSTVAKIFTGKGVATFDTITWNYCYIDGPGGMEYKAGGDDDFLKVKFMDNEAYPTIGSG